MLSVSEGKVCVTAVRLLCGGGSGKHNRSLTEGVPISKAMHGMASHFYLLSECSSQQKGVMFRLLSEGQKLTVIL